MTALGRVFWITGVSGAGKSTVAAAMAKRLKAAGESVVIVDGDVFREILDTGTGYDRQSRLMLGMRYARLAKVLAMQGITVLVATISLFKELHLWNRENQPHYFEVYLKTPLEELRRRDPKGIYRRFDLGEIKDVAGLDQLIDEPLCPDLLVEFDPSQLAEDIAHLIWATARSEA